MRKVLICGALAGALVLAVAGIAYAVNTYTVDPASTTPKGAGSKKKSTAKKVEFGFKAQDSSGGRASPIKKYKINFQGIKYFGKNFKKCKISDANGNDHATKCKKAKVGEGVVHNLAGQPNDIRPQSQVKCNLKLTVYNLGKGFALRLDGGPGVVVDGSDCPLAVGQAINAPFKKVKLGGIKSASLQFDVPSNLRHNVGLDVSVSSVSSTISSKKRKVKIGKKKRKVSVLSSVACKGKHRDISVDFTDETNNTVTATKTIDC